MPMTWLRKAGLKVAGMCPERLGEHEMLRLAEGLTCLLVPHHDFYELLAVESEYGTAHVPIVTRMRTDTRLLWLQGGKSLRETRGTAMLEAAIG